MHFTHAKKVPIPSSTANMKVATTVFVGNISEKASDTLIRQILLVKMVIVLGWYSDIIFSNVAVWSY